MEKTKNTAFKTALNLLRRRPYFSFELSQRLLEKGFNQNEIRKTIDKLSKSLLLSDEERFEELIDYYQNSKKFGLYRIKYELAKKNAPKEIIEEMLEKYYSKEIHKKVQIELIEKKKEELINEDDYKIKQKIYAYLKRKGF